jgi:hypothetical protein
MRDQVLLKGKPDEENTVEGPLYPPTLCLLMWPFALLVPVAAHAVLVFVYALLVFFTAWLLRDITRGQLRMGEAALIVTCFPCLYASLSLGQNSALTLAIATAGWALESRGRSFWAGVVWGLLAFKPVFAVALIGVPLIMLRWRMLLGMVLSGATFCLLTLPFLLPPERQCLWNWNEEREAWEWVPEGDELELSLRPWRRWWQVGQSARETYRTDRNWVWLSRDVLSIPRRKMWDGKHWNYHKLLTVHGVEIDSPEWKEKYEHLHQIVQPGDWVIGEGEDAVKIPIGALLVAGIAALTALIWISTALWRRGRGQGYGHDPAGPAAAFLLFGALLTTYHFMYYDLLVFALPMALFLNRINHIGPVRNSLLFILDVVQRTVLVILVAFFIAFSSEMTTGHGVVRMPLETFFLILFWAWAGCWTLVNTALPDCRKLVS